ncbi:BLUF domain-containing protein [Aequorivita sediminis]|uniref:BLUF domain-containing protein n=1 Tax=Aequorivita sediminis TaxID=3073653 RepID=UPI0028AC8C9D|nr:BLUF domain-containing protein [Aequorivita sp. F6058]
MKHTICYLSKDHQPMKNSELEDLFSQVLEFNNSSNISGILLHNNNFFLQVLEGKKENIQELYATIRKDNRHKDILIVLDQKIENRIFNNYDARFSILKNKDDIEKLNTYLSRYSSNNNYPTNIKRLLEPFLL